MLSPITGKSEAKLIEEIDAQTIIQLYQKELGIDVSRFFVNTPSVQIMQCQETGYRFYAPFSLAGDGEFYADLQQRFTVYYKDWKWEHQFADKYILPKQQVLEVGCATGYFMKRMKDKGCDCVGLEFNESAIMVAQEKGLTVFNEFIEAHATKNNEKYDVVCFFQVLEHINEVKSFLEASLTCLKKGGKLIIAVPNSNPYLFKYAKLYTLNLPPHHAGLWNIATFKSLEQHFSIKTTKVGIEPLYDVKSQISNYASHHNNKILKSLIQYTPAIFFKGIGRVFGKLWEGRNICIVFEKI